MIGEQTISKNTRRSAVALLAASALGLGLSSEATAAQPSVPKSLFTNLGSRILYASQAAKRKHNGDTTILLAKPNVREVVVTYDAKPAPNGNGIGTYTLAADFKITRHDRSLKLKNLIGAGVGENAGGDGASAQLQFWKKGAGFTFEGMYQEGANLPLMLNTDSQPENFLKFQSAMDQAGSVITTAPKGLPILSLTPAFVEAQ
jgi:hypothetical protein